MEYSYQGIDHVQIAAPANCEGVARHFYENILGMKELAKPINLQARGGIWFQCGNQQLHIGVQSNFLPAIKAHPAFQVIHLEALKQHLEEHGIDIIYDDAIEGIERFFLNDPFGNRIEFLEKEQVQ